MDALSTDGPAQGVDGVAARTAVRPGDRPPLEDGHRARDGGTGGRRRGAAIPARQRAAVWLALPAVLLVAVLVVVPIGQALFYSLTDWNGFTHTWIGVTNYRRLIEDPVSWRVLQNNLLLLLAVPPAVLLPFALAWLLHQQAPGWRVFRVLYVVPTAISWVVTAMFASRFFARDGLLNDVLSACGLGDFPTDLLSGERSALLAVAITFIWSMVGTNTLIFSAGLATLDPSLDEAARMDGAGAVERFVHVTAPQLSRFVQFALVQTTISAFTALFSLIFVMTGGGPGNGTTTMEFFVYQQAFTQGEFGLGAAVGMVLAVLIGIVVLLQVAVLSRWGRDER